MVNPERPDKVSDRDALADKLAETIHSHISIDAANCMQNRRDYDRVVAAIFARWQLTPNR